MGASERRAKDSKMAADLVARGIFHGKRQTSPSRNSGGTTMVFAPGSSKAQRLTDKKNR